MRILALLLLYSFTLVPCAWGAIAHETSVESHTGTTGNTSSAFFDFSVAFTSSSRGLLVFTYNANSNANDGTSVKIAPAGANTDVPAVTGGLAVDTVGEPGSCKAWFLGAGLPTTTTTVRVNRNNNANIMYAVAITVTGATASTFVVGTPVLQQGDGAIAESAVDSGAFSAMRYACGYNGANSPAVAGANSTLLQSIDFGSFGAAAARETTAGVQSRSAGLSVASDDRAAVTLAIAEVQGTGLITDSLVSYWELEELSGNRADSHGSNTLLDLIFTENVTAGKVGLAPAFLRANQDSLSHADSAAFSPGNTDFTFAMWVWMDDKTNHQIFLDKSTTSDTEYRMFFFVDDDTFNFAIYGGAGNTLQGSAGTFGLGSPAINTWHFLVGWYDSVTNLSNIQWNNGTVSVSATQTTGALNGTADFVLGLDPFNLGINGRLDQVGYWSRVLTSTERTTLYNSGNGLSYLALTGGSPPVISNSTLRRRAQ